MTEAEKLTPDDPDLLNKLALAYFYKQRYELAEQRYLKALKLRPGSSEYRNNLGVNYLQMNRWDNAIQQFKPEAAGTLPVRTDNLRAIQEGMQMVVKDPRGTAYYRLLGLDIPFAGKTGTAQTSPGLQPHAWFIGYTDAAGNTGKPDIAIAVLLESQGEGSDWAAPVFRGIVQAYYYGNTTTIPWFGPFDNPYTATPLGGVPTRTPKAKGRQTPPTP